MLIIKVILMVVIMVIIVVIIMLMIMVMIMAGSEVSGRSQAQVGNLSAAIFVQYFI